MTAGGPSGRYTEGWARRKNGFYLWFWAGTARLDKTAAVPQGLIHDGGVGPGLAQGPPIIFKTGRARLAVDFSDSLRTWKKSRAEQGQPSRFVSGLVGDGWSGGGENSIYRGVRSPRVTFGGEQFHARGRWESSLVMAKNFPPCPGPGRRS